VHSDNNTQLTQPYTLPFYVVSVFPSSLTPSLFNPHYRHPRGHPTIHNIASRQSSAHVFKTALLLVEDGIASDDQFLQSIPSLLLSFALPARPFVSPLPAAIRHEQRCANPSGRAAMRSIIWLIPDLLLHNLALIISILLGLTRATLPCYSTSGIVQTA
jgi:hypothetical protein